MQFVFISQITGSLVKKTIELRTHAITSGASFALLTDSSRYMDPREWIREWLAHKMAGSHYRRRRGLWLDA
jgi:hypothetical protein